MLSIIKKIYSFKVLWSLLLQAGATGRDAKATRLALPLPFSLPKKKNFG